MEKLKDDVKMSKWNQLRLDKTIVEPYCPACGKRMEYNKDTDRYECNQDFIYENTDYRRYPYD